METVIRPEVQLRTLKTNNRTIQLAIKDKSEITAIDFKFYQKLFLILIALSTILIFPESPKELEIVCRKHYSQQICKVW